MTYVHTPRFVGKPKPSRKIITGRRDCYTGDFQSTKSAMGFRTVSWEGLLTRDALYRIDFDRDVVSYLEEPKPFPWTDGISRHIYRPDFAVTYRDGRIICREVKPKIFVEKTRFEDKLPHIQTAAVEAGYDDADLWTEEHVRRGHDLANAQAVIGELTSPTTSESALHTTRMALTTLKGRSSIRQLRRMSGLGDQSYRSILRLIGLGELDYIETDRVIDDYTTVIFSESDGETHVK